MRRREWLRSLPALLVCTIPSAGGTGYASVVPGRTLRFPDDEGAHPSFRTEWWYITGWIDANSAPLGFQITFFRTRPHPDSGNPSRFDPREIIIGHAAVSERDHGRLRHAQRVQRAAFGLAHARTGRMDVRLDDWRLYSDADRYRALVSDPAFDLELSFTQTQPPLLQGDAGYSRKGPSPTSASYYYSQPHLAVSGRVRLDKRTVQATGNAWLDHEWSSEYLDRDAVGWDWIGINLDDGGALMAFRMRSRTGEQHWTSATHRSPVGLRRTFSPDAIAWKVQRRWRSPRTGADYPVAMSVAIEGVTYEIEPLFDDQENDTRLTTGTVYWEGAVIVSREKVRIGRGYLEMTGYAGKLRL